MAQVKYCCPGCCNKDYPNSFPDNKCINCDTPVPPKALELDDDIKQRLSFAHSLRRIKKFGDAKREFNNILVMTSENRDADQEILKEGRRQAGLGYFLSAYEVSDYKWNKAGDGLAHCECTSTSLTSVENSNFWRVATVFGNYRDRVLCRAVEEKRQRNVEVKNNIPRYQAIIICDPSNEQDINMAHEIYNILSKKADIFFAPITLKNIPLEDREFYIFQAIRNPDIVRLMFVIYSQTFDFQYTNKVYQSDIVRQCEDFAKAHQRDELYSVILGDASPSDDMYELSIKKINCRNVDDSACERISKALMKIIANHLCDEEAEELWEQKGELIPLNDGGFSPLITL